MAVLVLAAGCGDSKSCAASADCFRGEACIDGTCEIPDSPDSHSPNNRGNRDAGEPGDADNADGSTLPGDATSINNDDPACIIQPLGNRCDDDRYEPNENINTFQPLLWDNQSWCDGTELVPTQTSEALTLCAGDERDGFRLMIDNRMPDECLAGQFTWRIEVRIHTPCVAEVLNIEPYYSSPFSENRCDEDESFQCAWSDDGQTFTIEFVRQPDQLMDINLHVAAADGRNDVQIDYDVVMTLIQ